MPCWNYKLRRLSVIVYHGGFEIIKEPEIRITKFNKDFYFGFYCTIMEEQAKRWATRFGNVGYVNEYEYTEIVGLDICKFDNMTEEWLDFIVACRLGKKHDYDIVEGPIADDQIYNYIQGYIDGKYSREAFWDLVKFKYPTHQISFHTKRALETLKFVRGLKVYAEK